MARLKRTDGERQRDFPIRRIETLDQESRGDFSLSVVPPGHSLFETVSLGDSGFLNRCWQLDMVQHCANAMVPFFDLRRFPNGLETKVTWRPQFPPTLEPNLQQVLIYSRRTLDSHHAVDKSSASSIFPGTVEIAC